MVRIIFFNFEKREQRELLLFVPKSVSREFFKYKMAARSRWDQLGTRDEAAESIVTGMLKFCPSSCTWAETSDWPSNSLWGRLAERLLGVNRRRDRTWFRIIFRDNRNRVQVTH